MRFTLKILSKISLILYVVITFALLSTPLYAKDFHQTLEIQSQQQLVLRTDLGNIRINTHNKDTVIVDVAITGHNQDNFDIGTTTTKHAVLINGKKSNHDALGKWRSPNVKFTITLPEQFSLDLKTAGGNILIADLIGDINAKTSGGSIQIGNITGNIHMDTSGGSIKTRNINGEIDAHTSGGSIQVTFAQQPTQHANLTTSGGSIRAKFIKGIAIDLNAKTSGGRVSSDFDVVGKVTKQSIDGTINGGGPQVILKTSGGNVSVISI